MRKKSPQERFQAKIVVTDQCWFWAGTLDRDGYGELRLERRRQLVHRLAWELVAGPIPLGQQVLHTCDVRNCARNDDVGVYVLNGIEHPRRGHLWLGTTVDNSADRVQKGRAARGDRNGSRLHPERLKRGDDHPARQRPGWRRGEGNGRAKLTESDVRAIRKRSMDGEPQRSIARSYGIGQSQVGRIVHRYAWNDVE